MKKQIQYGEYKYEYYLIVQERKTISLTVYPDLQIMVKAPHNTSIKKIEEFFKRKWIWLEKQLSFFRKFQLTKTQKQYVSGESFLYLGRQYKLIVRRSNEDKMALQRGKLCLYTTGKVRDGRKNKELIEKWYAERTQCIFNERYNEVIKGFHYESIPKIYTRKMNKRWGSYMNNKILLNPLLIHASKKCIDYVISHELCHVEHNNHGKNFIKLLDSKYPNWEKIKEELELRFV